MMPLCSRWVTIFCLYPRDLEAYKKNQNFFQAIHKYYQKNSVLFRNLPVTTKIIMKIVDQLLTRFKLASSIFRSFDSNALKMA